MLIYIDFTGPGIDRLPHPYRQLIPNLKRLLIAHHKAATSGVINIEIRLLVPQPLLSKLSVIPGIRRYLLIPRSLSRRGARSSEEYLDIKQHYFRERLAKLSGNLPSLEAGRVLITIDENLVTALCQEQALPVLCLRLIYPYTINAGLVALLSPAQAQIKLAPDLTTIRMQLLRAAGNPESPIFAPYTGKGHRSVYQTENSRLLTITDASRDDLLDRVEELLNQGTEADLYLALEDRFHNDLERFREAARRLTRIAKLNDNVIYLGRVSKLGDLAPVFRVMSLVWSNHLSSLLEAAIHDKPAIAHGKARQYLPERSPSVSELLSKIKTSTPLANDPSHAVLLSACIQPQQQGLSYASLKKTCRNYLSQNHLFITEHTAPNTTEASAKLTHDLNLPAEQGNMSLYKRRWQKFLRDPVKFYMDSDKPWMRRIGRLMGWWFNDPLGAPVDVSHTSHDHQPNRKRHAFEVIISDRENINPFHKGGFHWKVVGPNPAMILENPMGDFPAGSYKVRLRIQAPLPQISPRIELDTGNGFNRQHVFTFTATRKGVVEGFFHCDVPVQRIRLEPFEQRAPFNLRRIHIRPIKKNGLTPLITNKRSDTTARHSPSTEERRYQEWLSRFATPSSRDLRRVRRQIPALMNSAQFAAFVLPGSTEETEASVLSLIAQELPLKKILVCSSTCIESNTMLGRYNKADALSAVGLKPQTYLFFISAGDKLAPLASYHLAATIAENPNVMAVYGDHDHCDESDKRHEPWFKPNWDPDLMLSLDYLQSACAIKASALPPDITIPTTESDRHRLFIRTLIAKTADQVAHNPTLIGQFLPRPTSPILQQDRTTTSLANENPPSNAAVKPVNVVTQSLYGQLPTPQPRVSIIIPTRDGPLLQQCVNSILESTDYHNYEILLIDNQSTQPETLNYFESLGSCDQVKVLRYPQPFNYSAINNYAERESSGEILALVNDDIEVIEPRWLEAMVTLAARPNTGAVGAKLLYRNGKVQHAGVVVGMFNGAGHCFRGGPEDSTRHMSLLQHTRRVSAVTGACLAVRRELYQQLDGLDEKQFTVAFNDVDFCLRLQSMGYHNLYTPKAKLYHHESISRGYDDTPEKSARSKAEAEALRRAWPDIIRNDPYYNPNLSLNAEDCSLAWPPRTTPPWK